MKNKLHSPAWLILLLITVSAIGCAADPWPEPDDMSEKNPSRTDKGDNGEDTAGDDNSAGNSEEDSEVPGDVDEEFTTDQALGGDTEMDSDTVMAPQATDDRGGESTDTTAEVDDDWDGDGDGKHNDDSSSEAEDFTDYADEANADAGVRDDAGSDGLNAPSGLDQVYCSSPNADGLVTIVGLAGTVLMNGEVTIVRNGSSVAIPVGSDGGFAGRVTAGPGESFDLVVHFADPPGDITKTLVTGPRVDTSVTTGIMGSAGTIRSLADEEQVILHGKGERLSAGHLVIGGNLDFSTGQGTPVSCSGNGCNFDLFMPGQPGNEIALFLVPLGQHTGDTDVQTLIVPPLQP